MEKHFFIDGFNQVHFIGGMVRITMFQYEAQENAEPTQESCAQLVMTPQAFVESLGAMQQMVERLIEAGILQRS
ncbi:MAG: hypothetical protein IJS54_06210 [Desulfovibrio sp.]|nr:hypothetical protein [Desulfovibrio sp.]